MLFISRLSLANKRHCLWNQFNVCSSLRFYSKIIVALLCCAYVSSYSLYKRQEHADIEPSMGGHTNPFLSELLREEQPKIQWLPTDSLRREDRFVKEEGKQDEHKEKTMGMPSEHLNSVPSESKMGPRKRTDGKRKEEPQLKTKKQPSKPKGSNRNGNSRKFDSSHHLPQGKSLFPPSNTEDDFLNEFMEKKDLEVDLVQVHRLHLLKNHLKNKRWSVKPSIMVVPTPNLGTQQKSVPLPNLSLTVPSKTLYRGRREAEPVSSDVVPVSNVSNNANTNTNNNSNNNNKGETEFGKALPLPTSPHPPPPTPAQKSHVVLEPSVTTTVVPPEHSNTNTASENGSVAPNEELRPSMGVEDSQNPSITSTSIEMKPTTPVSVLQLDSASLTPTLSIQEPVQTLDERAPLPHLFSYFSEKKRKKEQLDSSSSSLNTLDSSPESPALFSSSASSSSPSSSSSSSSSSLNFHTPEEEKAKLVEVASQLVKPKAEQVTAKSKTTHDEAQQVLQKEKTPKSELKGNDQSELPSYPDLPDIEDEKTPLTSNPLFLAAVITPTAAMVLSISSFFVYRKYKSVS